MVRLASIGDTHLGASVLGYDLTPSTRGVLFAFARFCKRNNVQVAVHLGDLFDSCRPTTANLKLSLQWCRTMSDLGLRLFLLTGNHDVSSRPGTTSALDVLRSAQIPNVRVVDRPIAVRVALHTALALLPYPSSTTYTSIGEWRSFVHSAVRDAAGLARRVLIYSHLDVHGAQEPTGYIGEPGVFALPKEATTTWGGLVAISGHHHQEQIAGPVRVQGSAQRTDFGERDISPVFYIVDGAGRVMRTAAAPAQRMVQIDLDCAAATTGDRFVVTSDVLPAVACMRVRGALVKLQARVNNKVTVDWRTVEDAVKAAGASHVFPTVCTRAREKGVDSGGVIQGAARSIVGLSRRWIEGRVRSKAEQRRLLHMLKRIKDD